MKPWIPITAGAVAGFMVAVLLISLTGKADATGIECPASTGDEWIECIPEFSPDIKKLAQIYFEINKTKHLANGLPWNTKAGEQVFFETIDEIEKILIEMINPEDANPEQSRTEA